jgi:MerR family transcriptional regulator/heat shock protein HspR
MNKDFWTIHEVIEIFEVDEQWLRALEEEDIVCPECRGDDEKEKRFPTHEMEKIRLVKILMQDMGVNLAGVDIILRMRSDMIAMRAQFDSILEDLAAQIRRRFGEKT